MSSISLLRDHPETINEVAYLWYETIGRKWMPEIRLKEIIDLYEEELDNKTTLTYIAQDDSSTVIGSCTFQLQEVICPTKGPWVGDLAVKPSYQRQGVGKDLLNIVKKRAQSLGFKSLFTFTFDEIASSYYQHQGWHIIGTDNFGTKSVNILKVQL